MSIIELSQIGQDLFDFSDLTWGHPLTHSSTHRYLQTKSNYINKFNWDPTHWPTHPPTHPPMGGCVGEGVSTNHKSSNRIELSRLGQDFKNFLVFWPDPTHQPTHPSTHPPNYTPTHGWGSLHRFQIFKQNWNISISSTTIEFWLILRAPGGERVPPTHVHMHTHTHTCTHACTCIWHHREFPGIPQKSNGSSHLHEIIMFTMRTCACMCTCVGAPPNNPHPHPPTPSPPEPQGAQTPKFNKSWTNRDNSILFEDSLPLNIPKLI